MAGLLLFLAAAPCRAQITIEATTLTCQDFLTETVVDRDKISYWLSGYYNGKRRNTNLSVNALLDFISKMPDYCQNNPNVTVMKAAAALLDGK